MTEKLRVADPAPTNAMVSPWVEESALHSGNRQRFRDGCSEFAGPQTGLPLRGNIPQEGPKFSDLQPTDLSPPGVHGFPLTPWPFAHPKEFPTESRPKKSLKTAPFSTGLVSPAFQTTRLRAAARLPLTFFDRGQEASQGSSRSP